MNANLLNSPQIHLTRPQIELNSTTTWKPTNDCTKVGGLHAPNLFLLLPLCARAVVLFVPKAKLARSLAVYHSTHEQAANAIIIIVIIIGGGGVVIIITIVVVVCCARSAAAGNESLCQQRLASRFAHALQRT